MRAKSMAMLMLALGCGLVASIGITQVLANRRSSPTGTAGETATIFVAIKDIPLGSILTAEVLKLEPWPKDRIPPGALSNISDVEGRRTRQKLFSGEPILENKLLGKGANAQGASAVIPKGYRVVAVQVDSVSGSGLILPGDRVDVLVYLVGNSQREIPDTSTRTVLQDIKVFAVNEVVELDKDKDKERPSSKTISLLVTPAQAAKVTLASEMGKIRLVMRSPEDNSHAEDASAKPEELLGRPAYADRVKEGTLDKNSEATKGLLDYINKMKAGMAASQTKTSPAQQPQPPSTWTMRILQPNGINDVVLEADNTPATENSLGGHWRITGSASSAENSKPAPDQTAPEKNEVQPLPPPITPPTTIDPWAEDQNQSNTPEQTLIPNSASDPAQPGQEPIKGE